MNIFHTVFSTLSDLLFLAVIFHALDITGFSNDRPTPKKIISGAIFISVMGIISYSMIFTEVMPVQLIVSLINPLKFCITALFAYRRYPFKTIFIVLIIQFVCELLSYTIQFVIPISIKIQEENPDILILGIIRAVLLIAFVIIKPKAMGKAERIFNLLPVHIFILIFLSSFLTSGLIRIADLETSDTELQMIFVRLLSVSIIFCTVSVLISLLTNVLHKKYYSDMNNLLKKQVQIQLAHYERREKINTEIRGFKHDYINHINCIKTLLNSGKYTETAEYLNNISASFPSDCFLYSTGNYISDAILSDKQETAARDNTTISFNGTIPTFMNNTDLCIVLSNAVDNAIEACRGSEGEKNIEVFGGFSHGYFVLTVKNPTLSSIDTAKKLPATTKKDSLYHGFGLQNIEAVVHKYSGSMKIENKDNSFILSLTFNSGTVN